MARNNISCNSKNSHKHGNSVRVIILIGGLNETNGTSEKKGKGGRKYQNSDSL